MKKFIVFLLILLAGGAAYWYFYRKPVAVQPGQVAYRSSRIERRTIVQEVSATGTIEPLKKVDVGTQVTGKVIKLNADFNSHVTEGQVVAEIDPATYQASYAGAQAQLASAEANLEKTSASLVLAEKELVRMKTLLEKEMVSASEYDTALATRDQLLAEIKINRASIEQAKANASQAKTNLDYCTIVSPVTGVVISRDVDEGQTVVSNMSVSSMFEIATDLSKVKVEASVPEADVGQLKLDQDVEFTVDAYPMKFHGKVVQIRLAATTESNVVTYPVIVEAENPGERLFPGMTATISIIVSKSENCLVVPASALRFKPEGMETPKDGKYIWLINGPGRVEPMKVKLGLSDNIFVEIQSEQPLDGREVATGIMSANEAKAGAAVNNPFAMKPPKGGPPGPPPR